MPVFDLTSGWVHPAARPSWLGVSAIGRFQVRLGGARFDRHYHDDHELWLVVRGKAKVLTDGGEHYVQGGDVVVTQAGDEHDVLEVYEELEGFFVETGLPEGGGARHLHRRQEDRLGHEVPARPVPADFPVREGRTDMRGNQP